MRRKVKRHLSFFLTILCIYSLWMPIGQAEAAQTFSDVKPTDWHYSVIMKMTEDGYLSGYKDGTFRPDQNVTAAEMIVILQRAFRDPSQIPPSSQWKTFPWHTLEWFPANYFLGKYSSLVSRNTLCYFLLLAMDKPILVQELYAPTGLKDPISNSVFTCYRHGYVSGYDDGMFHGADLVTRAQLCAIIYRALYQNPNPSAPQIDYEVTQPYELYGFDDPFPAEQAMQAALLAVPENLLMRFQEDGFLLIGATATEYQRLWETYIKSEFAYSSGVFFCHKEEENEENQAYEVLKMGTVGGIMVANIEASTVTHEFGHYLYYFFLDEKKVDQLFANEKEGVIKAAARNYGETNAHEFIAEAFRVYCSQPSLLKHHAPNTYQYIDLTLKNDV